MKTLLALVLACAFLPPAFADNQKAQERVKGSSDVLKMAQDETQHTVFPVAVRMAKPVTLLRRSARYTRA